MNKDILDEKLYSTTANKYRREIYRINQKLKQVYKKVDEEGLKKIAIEQSIREEVVSLYFSGNFQLHEFSNLFYVHNSTVRKWIAKYGDKYRLTKNQIKEELNQKGIEESRSHEPKAQNSKQELRVNNNNNTLGLNEKKEFITVNVLEEVIKKDGEELEEEINELNYIDMSEKRVLVSNNRKSLNDNYLDKYSDEYISITYPNKTTIKIPKSMLSRDLLHDMYLIHLPDI